MKRGTDHNWEMRRYRGDTAIYAHCKCGFEYNCSKNVNEDGYWKTIINTHYIFWYCPRCGARKKTYDTQITKIDRERWG